MSPNKKPATIPSAGRVGKSIKKIKTISPAARGNYPGLLADIKQRIRAAQVRAAMAGNAHMLLLYWEIGRELAKRQQQEGWGAAVLPRLAADLRNELPDVKGFSSRNLKRMVQFFREYPSLFAIGPTTSSSFRRSKTCPRASGMRSRLSHTVGAATFSRCRFKAAPANATAKRSLISSRPCPRRNRTSRRNS